MDIKKLTALANRSTRARRRAEARGFAFDTIEVVKIRDRKVVHAWVIALFRCVCGRSETLRYSHTSHEMKAVSDSTLERMFDPAAVLERIGSFSAKHLRDDGYTPLQISEILNRGKKFDMENPR